MNISAKSFVVAAVVAVVGLLLSQYYPQFSGVLEQKLCAPWSPCRQGLLAGYVLGGAIVGFFVGSIGSGRKAPGE